MSEPIRQTTGQKRVYSEGPETHRPKKRTKFNFYPNPQERAQSALNPMSATISQKDEEIRSLRERVNQLEAQVSTLTGSKTTEILQRNFPKTPKDEQQRSPTLIQNPAQNVPHIEEDEEEEELSSDEESHVVSTPTPEGGSAQFCLFNGLVSMDKKNYSEALVHLSQVPSDGSGYGRARFNMGFCYQKQSRLNPAANHFALVPSSDIVYYGKAQFNMGMCYQKLWEYEKAITYYRNVPRTNECLFFLAQYHLGICHERLDKIPEAIVYFSSVPLSHPKNPHAHLRLGSCYTKQDEVLLARSHWNLVTDSKLYEKAQFNIGVDYEKKDNLPLIAIDHYMKVTKLNPKLYDAARFRMGLCHYRNNQFEQAKSKFSDVSESYERNSEAQDYIKKIITGNHCS